MRKSSAIPLSPAETLLMTSLKEQYQLSETDVLRESLHVVGELLSQLNASSRTDSLRADCISFASMSNSEKQKLLRIIEVHFETNAIIRSISRSLNLTNGVTP